MYRVYNVYSAYFKIVVSIIDHQPFGNAFFPFRMALSGKTVAIIGGGVSGIVQAKWLLTHELGCRILLFESRSSFGGVWDVSGPNGVMDCTFCNVSKYLMELTDFPWPDGTIDFPHHSDVLKYIKSYADKFIVNTPVECYFDCHVLCVKKKGNVFTVESRNLKSQSETAVTADYLIVANGHATLPNYSVNGVQDLHFVSHSAGYKNCSRLGLLKKKVLVIGLSFSAVDIAVDLNQVGKNDVTVLTRSGSWFGPKRRKFNIPNDLKLPRIFTYLPHKIQNMLIKLAFNWTYFNQNNWQISNKCDPAGGSIVSSEEFVNLVRTNKISVINGSLMDVNSDRTVLIKDNEGHELTLEYDHVIFCTGYKTQFDFLSDDLKVGDGQHPDLYLGMIPLDNSSLMSYIGLFNARYTSPFQVIDLQAQYIAALLSGKVKLPDQNEMENSVAKQKHHLATNCKSYRASLFLPSDYRDQLAHIIGKTPKFLDLVLSPRLFIEYYFGPITWAGYNVSDPKLAADAKASLNETCDRAFGKNWYLKLNCLLIGGILTVTCGAFILQNYF